MPKVKNTTKADIVLPTGNVLEAGKSTTVGDDVLVNMDNRVALNNAKRKGHIEITGEKKPAKGDGKRSEGLRESPENKALVQPETAATPTAEQIGNMNAVQLGSAILAAGLDDTGDSVKDRAALMEHFGFANV